MSRSKSLLAAVVWALGGIALGQGMPTTPPTFEFPVVESGSDVQPAPEAAAQPSPTDQQPAAPADPAKTAATVQELAKTVETLGKNLTVVTGNEQIKLVLGGAIVADFLYNEARAIAPGTPFFLVPGSVRFAEDTFDAHARQTSLFALVSGPKICGLDSGGLVAICLYNDALIVDRYGILPFQAWAHLKNDEWRFAAGLQFDVFNPLVPNMLPFSLLVASGNSGNNFRGQARVERYFYPTPDSQVTLTGAISEPIATSISRTLELNEDNGWPNLEGRAALSLGPVSGEGLEAKRPFEAGISAVGGEIRTTVPLVTQVVGDVWGLGLDLRWAVTERFGVLAEVFTGQGLGTYNAGVLQLVNSDTFQTIHSSGGFLELYYYLCPDKLHTHIGYGLDDPLDSDLALGQIVRNETYYANLLWDVTPLFRLGFEVSYRETAYSVLTDNDGMGYHVQCKYKF
jgi:hypothetical protein